MGSCYRLLNFESRGIRGREGLGRCDRYGEQQEKVCLEEWKRNKTKKTVLRVLTPSCPWPAGGSGRVG